MTTPSPAKVFIRVERLGEDFTLDIFFDECGTDKMTNEKPLALRGDGRGEIQFNFIPPAAGGSVVTADLVIIGQTLEDPAAPRGHRRASPFKHPHAPSAKFYPTYYLPSPAGEKDPTNLLCQCKRTCDGCGYVEGRTLKVIKAPGARRSKPYKYTIVALCDGATKVVGIDPTGIINPH